MTNVFTLDTTQEADEHAPVPAGIVRTLAHDTSRTYAKKAASRVLPKWVNRVLKDAAAGRKFDAWVFQCALTQVLSLAATRDGQSMGRRNWTREARHLAYANQAVLQNALQELPPVEPGQRSPRIAALEEELSTVREDLATARRDYALADERVTTLVREKTAAEAEIGAQADLTRRVRIEEREATARAYRAERVLAYALTLLDPDLRARVDGYTDGISDNA